MLHSYNVLSSGSEKNMNVCVCMHVYIYREKANLATLIIG